MFNCTKRFRQKSNCSHAFFQISCTFAEQELLQGDIIIILIHPWYQACIYWKKSVIWWHHFHPIIFSITELLFHGRTWSDSLCQGHCVHFTMLAAAIHYNKRSMVYLRETIVALWICNLWISGHFLKKKSKNGFHWNSLADCKTYVPQVVFFWVVKINKVDFNLIFNKCENVIVTFYVLIPIIM